MAFAREVYAGNGINRLFNVPFPYLSTSHVEVRVAGVLQSAYAWINATTIEMTTAPANGAAIEVKRNTPKTSRLVDWSDGSGLREADLDLADLQVLYITQEAFDAAELALAEDAQGRLDAKNKRIINVAAPVEPNDAVNKAYVDPVIATATTQANNAANSAAAALTSENNANAARIAAEGARDTALTHRDAAAASALAAQAATDSVLWRDVVFLTSASSPYTVTTADRGKLFSVDCSGGPVTVNLPTIAGLSLTSAFVLGFKKSDGTANAVTINRGGTDTIDGATSKALTGQGSGTTLTPDVDPAPDMWVSADFGASAGNIAFDAFTGNGSNTTFTLSQAPGSANAVALYVSGIRQRPIVDYTTSGTTLTTTVAPANGVPVYAASVSSLPVGVPADGSVTNPKVAARAITPDKLASAAVPLSADGRLTLTSGVPVTTGDVTAASTLFYTPYVGNRLALFDGTNWNLYSFTERSIALSGLVSGRPYDVFAFDNAGTITLELTAWTNDTTRATALVRQDGVWVRSGATTRRYLGTIYTTGATTTEDSAANRFVWNAYNRVERQQSVVDTTASWTYTSNTWRQANGSAANQYRFVTGLAEDAAEASVIALALNSSGWTCNVGVGVNSTTANSAQVRRGSANSSSTSVVHAQWRGVPAVGLTTLAWLEASSPNATTTWFGSANNSDNGQSGMVGRSRA